MLRFMPRFLVEKYMKDQEMKRKLQITFDRFNKIQENITADHFVSKYIEVYEKDKMCGRHIYRLKQVGLCVVVCAYTHTFEHTHTVTMHVFNVPLPDTAGWQAKGSVPVGGVL